MNFSQFGARSRRRLPTLAAGAALAAALLLGANDGSALEVASSYNPVGSGARASGMGGAFIAVADDATAASWNPAGLVQLEKPEFSVVYGYFNRDQTYSADPSSGLNGQNNSMDANGINYASFVYPFTLASKNMVVSLNYQRLFDMNKEVKFRFNNPGTLTIDQTLSQKGYLSTLTPAFAIQVIPELYLGVAVNIWDDFMGTSSWETNTRLTGQGFFGGNTFPIDQTSHAKSEFSGVNATAGFLLNLNKLTIGGVFKSPFSGRMKVSSTGTDSVNGDPLPTSVVDHLDMPMSAGLGTSYRFSDKFLASVDAYWTQWSKFSQRGTDVNTGLELGSNPFTNGFEKLNDTVQVRLGAEYLFMNGKSVIPARAGLFYDPEPGPAGGIDKYFGFSLGSGYTWENYSFDVAYQFRKGNNVSSDLTGAPNISSTMTQHTVLTSLIYRF